jgi:hypothetical protein
MEQLIEKGFQLRIYAGRPMPSFSTLEDPKVLLQILNGQEVPPAVSEKPIPVNYTLVTPLMPRMSLYETVATLRSRIQRDPTLSRPLIIISDGDLPGLVQARLHGIPSIHVTHGETFASLPPPYWMTDPKQQAAWRREQVKNKRFNHNLARYTVATNHVPMEGSALTRLRSFVRHLARRRAQFLQDYNNFLSNNTQQSPRSSSQRNRMVVTYFRDANGQKVVETLAAEGLDVLAFGAIDPNVTVQGSGRILHVKDSSYFAQLLSVADGVVASGGCQLIAECVYSQIPILVLYKESDDEHWLNALMAKRLRYRDGRRIAYAASFGSLENGLVPSEVKFFAAHVKQSNASRSFYEHHLDMDVNVDQPIMPNELVENNKDSADRILDIVERVQSETTCYIDYKMEN